MKPRIRVVRPSDEPVEAITLAERVHRELREDIISGAIDAGQPLRLEYLKERYGISFSPLREALNRLQTERLVVSTPSRGFRVAPFSEEEMWDVIETRILVECEALRRSLVRGDEAWEAGLVQAFDDLMQASGRPDQQETPASSLEQRHQAFHDSLIAACGSPWLLTLAAQLYAQTERYRRPTLRDPQYLAPSRDVRAEHRRLLDAAVARDAVLAAGLLARHYRETGRLVKRILKLGDGPEPPRASMAGEGG